MGEQQQLLQYPEIILQNPLESPPEEFSAIDPPDFSVLRLHSSPPFSSSATAHRRHSHHSPCSSCGCSGHSRKRPAIPNHHHLNPAKKLFLDTPPPENQHHDCTEAAFLPLRRTVSDSSSGPGVPSNASPAQQSPSAYTPGSASNSSLPPLPPTLRRCTSDPIPSPTPPPSQSNLRTWSSSAQELGRDTPISKRSKMLSSWRKFNEWIEEEFTGDTEHQTQDHRRHAAEHIPPTTLVTAPTNDSNKEESAAELEESLSVERDGERLNIHFKCHCGNAYQFLLADGNCYYKLM